MDEKLNIYLDKCIGYNDTHYDIAKYIYEVLKDKFKYNEKTNKWLYLDKDDTSNLNKLKREIKTTIVNHFILRSVYWNKNDLDENKICSFHLIQIAHKLKNDKFLRAIIKEIKQFY
jgi:hypothetical protein